MTAPTYLNTRTADMPTTEQLLREAVATLRAFIKPLRAMGHQSDAIDAAPDLMARIDAYLAQQSALDELVRENERLGLYDDQKPAQETKCACSPDMYVAGYTGGAAPEGLFGKLYVYIEGASRSVEYAPVAAPAPAQPVTDAQPVAWRYRDYVSGCWFVSAEPYPAGSIAGESVPLYLAPAPAQSRQPLSEWIACSEQMPILSEGDDELPVYTWDGESVKADEFGFLFEQPAGPAVGGWVCIGADFLNNLSGTVTHWMPRNMPAAPERAITGDKP